MNKNLQNIVDSLNSYKARRLRWVRDFRTIMVTYKESPEKRDALRDMTASAEQDLNDTMRAIAGYIADGQRQASEWGTPYGSEIDKDANLLDYGLAADAYDTLVDRHAKNGTMCAILREFGEKHMYKNLPPTVDELKAAWDKIAGAAGAVCRAIFQDITENVTEDMQAVRDKALSAAPLNDGSTPLIDAQIEALYKSNVGDLINKYL